MYSRDYWVREISGVQKPLTEPVRCLHLRFEATATETQLVDEDGYTTFVVPAQWRRLRALFGPYQIIQHFVKDVLEHKPHRVIFDCVSGASADLARISVALGVETLLLIKEAALLEPADSDEQRWTQGLLTCVDGVVWNNSATPELLERNFPRARPRLFNGLPETPIKDRTQPATLGYEAYAFGMRDHALLTAMQADDVNHFEGCANVLDVGCGTGVFLECLHRGGIPASGVERNEQSASFARSLGLQVHTQDALVFLANQNEVFDGIYCSHFVEHLPFEAVDRLMQSVALALKPGGTAVFVFPDPESIRSQLLGFWRDPEHVRFYHPEILEVLASVHGLTLVSNSQKIPGRSVGNFTLMPPPFVDAPSDSAMPRRGLWSRLLRRLGIVQADDLESERKQRIHLEATMQQLWQVSQTWAWEDNATLKFRKSRHD
jgi:O-antigen chain-terminating methyltransferase